MVPHFHSLHHENPVLNIIHDPVDAFKQALAGDGATRHYAPVAALDTLVGVQLESFTDLLRGESSGNVLLVAEDEECGTGQLLLEEKLLKLLLAVLKSELVSAVNDPDESISLLKVISPVRADGGLTSDIPHI